MNRKKVYYFGTYDVPESMYKRRYTVPATAKMDYIISAINQAGYDVELISSSYIVENRWCFDVGGKKRLNDHTVLHLSPSFGYKIFIGKYLGIVFTSLFFFFKLLQIKKEETLIVYHGGWYSTPVSVAKKIKGFQLIVEVEEIYTYAFNRNIKGLKKELDFISSADKYILVNDLIADVLKVSDKPYITCYGPYEISTDAEPIQFEDTKTHIVYAGSFSTTKGGVHNAIEAAPYLSEDYIMHILGFGEKKVVKELKERIEEINKESNCKIIFEGEKRGKEYYSFMKACAIGLNPQKWGDYMLYAYPSKVLVYFTLGLNVVTSPLKTLRSSSIDHYFNYFEDESPEALAKAIQAAKIYPKNELREAVKDLHENFVKDINQLIRRK